MWHSMVMLGLGLAEVASAAPCAEPARSAEILALLEVADGAYATLDVDGFLAALEQAQDKLPCVDDPVSKHLAAELHRHEGLRAFIDRDGARSKAAFAAARLIEPGFQFPTTLVPAGNPVLAEYAALDPSGLEPQVLPEPAQGWLQLDGQASRDRFVGLPTVFQRFSADGAVAETAWVAQNVLAPPYDVAVAGSDPGPASAEPPTVREPRGKVSVPLVVVAAVSGAVAAGTFGGSWASRSAYFATDDVDRAIALRQQTNGLTVAAAGSGAVALGAGVGALLTIRR